MKYEVLTPIKLLEQGLYACSSCGKLNKIENQFCINCKEEKFIITKQNETKN